MKQNNLYDAIWDNAEEMDDMDLYRLGMKEDDIASFFEDGFVAFRMNDSVFVLDEVNVCGKFTVAEFTGKARNRSILQEIENGSFNNMAQELVLTA